MPEKKRDLLHLHAADGTFVGVFISPELREKTQAEIGPVLEAASMGNDASAVVAPLTPEPMNDWETLLTYWDFKYPPAYDLTCEHCGAHTEDWRADEPRKFRLTAANLGGLATFCCQSCRSKIIKRHFKKHVSVECHPYVEKP
jgi:hypothetical protein